jgi:hypothetical protein
MNTIFLVCAILGGGILIIQLVLSLIGLGAHALSFDVSGDIHTGDVGGDFHTGDFHTGEFHTGDVHTGDFHAGDVHTGDVHADASGHEGGLHPSAHHFDSTWLFTVISFRTVVAALTFFGLAGLAAQEADFATPVVLLVAIASGLAAMFAVYWLMRALMSLRAEGTALVTNAVGRTGTVYTTIPAEGAGSGKIQLNLQGRTMEYLAVTSGHELKPGAKVVVAGVVTSDTLDVQPALEESSDHAPEKTNH